MKNMQLLYTFYLYINTGDIKGIKMFVASFQQNLNYISNPFAMGLMSVNPRLDFFSGLAAATSPMSNPFMNSSIFTVPTFNFSNVTPSVYTNPFAMGIGALPTMPVLPTFQMPTFAFPSFKVESQGVSNNYGVEKYTTASKIKPGLLKGNLKGKEGVITALCEKYGVDIALVVSIIGQESGFGTSNLAQHNNFMGYRASGNLGKSSKGFGYFSTPEKGLEAAIKNISRYPERYASVKKADMNNIDSIGKIYCEGSTYANSIKNIYNTTVKSYLA